MSPTIGDRAGFFGFALPSEEEEEEEQHRDWIYFRPEYESEPQNSNKLTMTSTKGKKRHHEALLRPPDRPSHVTAVPGGR